MRWTLRMALLALGIAAGLAAGSSQLAAASKPALASAASRQLPAASSEVIVPVLGVAPDRLVSTFNQARVGHVHHALDILAPRGTPVLAAVDGTIRKLFFSGAGGITIYQFDRAQSLVYYYAHLDRYADGLREGMQVKQGDVIGYVGTTGNAPEGTPHLHFAIARLTPAKTWWEGEAIDPYPILTAAAPRSADAGR